MKPFYDLLNDRIQKHAAILQSGTGRKVVNLGGRKTAHQKDIPFGMKIKAFRGILVETKALLRAKIGRFDCPPGCSDCCNRIPIIASRMEYEYLTREILKNFKAKGHGEKRYSAVYRVWKRFCDVYGIRHGNPFVTTASSRAWADLSIPCIFRGEDGCLLVDRPVECLFLRRTERACEQIIPESLSVDGWLRFIERSSIESGTSDYLATRGYLDELQRPVDPFESHLAVLRRWCHKIDTWVYPSKTKFISMPIFSLLGPPR